MRTTLLLSLVLLFTLSLCAGAAQLLLNRGFEDSTNHSNYWTITTFAVKQYANSFMSPGVPAGQPTTTWGLEAVSNSGTQAGNANQTATVAAGIYTVSASAWVRLLSGPAYASWARIRVFADGVRVLEQRVDGTLGAWTDWTQLATTEWTGAVSSTLEIRFAATADGRGGDAWGQVAADLFRLDATQVVPEPASLLALAAGLVGVVARRRK